MTFTCGFKTKKRVFSTLTIGTYKLSFLFFFTKNQFRHYFNVWLCFETKLNRFSFKFFYSIHKRSIVVSIKSKTNIIETNH